MKRWLRVSATLVVTGLCLAYLVGAYLWIEGAFVIGTIVLAILLFSVRMRPLLARTVPLLRRVRLERPLRAVYEGLHSYRGNAGLLFWMFAVPVAIQSVRVL